MGVIIEKILGDVEKDPKYENFTIELNADAKVQVHHGNIRLGIHKDDWEILKKSLLEARDKLFSDERIG